MSGNVPMINWGGVKIRKDDVENKSTLKIPNDPKTYYVIEFKTGVRMVYEESKGGRAGSYNLITSTSSSFENIKGLSVEGTQKDDLVYVQNCKIDRINLANDDNNENIHDNIFVYDSKGGEVRLGQNDFKTAENNENVKFTRVEDR